MFGPLALILLAVAVFSAVVTRRRTPSASSRLDPDQLRGFIYVGSFALTALAICVVVLGLWNDHDGRAESVAVLGFVAYAIYLGAAAVISYASTRRP